MSVLIDLTGLRFERLTVIGRAESQRHPNGSMTAMWHCRCDCGNEHIASGANLKSGNTKSCGCYAAEHPSFFTHRKSNTKLYGVWRGMKNRCCNVRQKSFRHYGAKGITVCDEWLSFEAFYEWSLQNGYREGVTIDRIDTSKGYYPQNCRWVDLKTQQNNRSDNHIITHNGLSLTMSQWADRSGLPYITLLQRIVKLGWSVERAISTPVRGMRRCKNHT